MELKKLLKLAKGGSGSVKAEKAAVHAGIGQTCSLTKRSWLRVRLPLLVLCPEPATVLRLLLEKDRFWLRQGQRDCRSR